MPQNETTLFLHFVLTFNLLVSLSLIIILYYNFLPVFKYVKLIFILDKDNFLSFTNSIFLVTFFSIRYNEINFNIFPLLKFLNFSFINLLSFIFKNKIRKPGLSIGLFNKLSLYFKN